MVVDIQGSGYMYTDPQLHSHKKEFGKADRGVSGFQDFFKTHQCNAICQQIGLKNRSSSSAAASSKSAGSTAVKREKTP